MAELPDPVASLDFKGRQLYDLLVAKRGRIDGMYRTMLNHPNLTQHVSQLGSFLRFEGTLPADVRELAILTTAYETQAGYEWVKHVFSAQQSGLKENVIERIRKGEKLDDISPLYSSVQKVVKIVLTDQSIPESLQQCLLQAFGVKGLIELVILCGFYKMIAGLIFAFDIKLPQGEIYPF